MIRSVVLFAAAFILVFALSVPSSYASSRKHLFVQIDKGVVNVHYAKVSSGSGYELSWSKPDSCDAKVIVKQEDNDVYVEHDGDCFKGAEFDLTLDPSMDVKLVLGAGIVNADSSDFKKYAKNIAAFVKAGIIRGGPFGPVKIGIYRKFKYKSSTDTYFKASVSAGIINFY